MKNIKLVLEYDGSMFFGFQKQPGKPTIQEALEKALSGFFDRKMKIAAASGRTDTGVHAEGQVVNFKTSSPRELWQIQKGLNAFLPPSVAVKEIEEVPTDFHSRYSVRSKVYEYRIWNHPCRSPLIAGRAFHAPHPLNVTKMRQAAKTFLGRHDFRSFTSEAMIFRGKLRKDENICHSREGGNPALDPRLKHSGMTAGQSRNILKVNFVRTIKRFQIKKQGHLLLMQVEADGFLYHMIRNMVGTLLEVGRGKRKPENIAAILKAKNRRLAGVTAPAEGLTLLNVRY